MRRRSRIAGCVAAAALAGGAVAGAAVGDGATPAATVVPLKDARLKLEINATDGDGGVQVFLDAESWKEMSIFDPAGRRIFRSTTSGRMGRQGGTELFLESAEPPFSELPVTKLLERFPRGTYSVRGVGLGGERYAGSARLSHAIPDGPKLVSPLAGSPPQDPGATTVAWKPVAPPAGSRIIGYQVLVVQPETGLRALPTVTLDVIMPPAATSMRVPPGFLRRGTEYEWEVLAIERGGNQTLSSSTFRTAP